MARGGGAGEAARLPGTEETVPQEPSAPTWAAHIPRHHSPRLPVRRPGDCDETFAAGPAEPRKRPVDFRAGSSRVARLGPHPQGPHRPPGPPGIQGRPYEIVNLPPRNVD